MRGVDSKARVSAANSLVPDITRVPQLSRMLLERYRYERFGEGWQLPTAVARAETPSRLG